MSNHATNIVIFFETTKLSKYKKINLILPLPLQQEPQLRVPLRPLPPQLQEPQQELRPQPWEQTYENDELTSSWYPLPFQDQSQPAQ